MTVGEGFFYEEVKYAETLALLRPEKRHAVVPLYVSLEPRSL